MEKEKLILVTNDDGVNAKGIKALMEALRPLGKVVVVAPEDPQSGMSHAITVKHPLRIKALKEERGLDVFSINGTPVDCVKLGLNKILTRKPDLLVSGINHGSNSSTSVLYSGTMGAAIEGSVNFIPSIGMSLLNHSEEANMEVAAGYSNKIATKVLANGLPKNICLNVNVPDLPQSKMKGIKVCRQTMGNWQEEFEKRTDPRGSHYYWLTGYFRNHEPDAEDTDEWALHNGYVSIVPTQPDLTCYNTLKEIKSWKLSD